MLALFSSVDKVQRFDGVRAPRSWGARFTGMLVFTACLAFVAALPDLLKFLGSWKHAWKVLVPALLVCVSLHAQTANKIAPDCPIVIASRSTTGTSSVYDNRPQSGSTSPCTELIFTASATTTNSSFTIAVEGAQDNGAASCAGCSWSTLGSLTLSAEGTIKAPTGTYADYIRINLSAITGGSVSGVLTGWRPNQSTVAGGGGGGGMCPGGSATEIQVTDGTMCVGFADFVWNEVATGTGMTGMNIGETQPDFSSTNGPSNGLSAVRDGSSSDFNSAIETVNVAAAGTGQPGTTHDYYASGGTVASPTNLAEAEANIFTIDNFAYSGSGWMLASQETFGLDSSFNGYWYLNVCPTTGCGNGSTIDFDSTNGIFRILNNNSGAVGFLPVGATEVELDDGTTPSSLAQLDLGVALIGSNDSAALAAFQAGVTIGSVELAAIGNGSDTFGEMIQYDPSGAAPPILYWVGSGGTFSLPTDSTNGDVLGDLELVFYDSGWHSATTSLLGVVDDVTTGDAHFRLIGSWDFDSSTANQALVTDSNNFVVGITGFSGSGTACTITAITDGIITAASCT